jgi:hypothetical protein
MGTVGSWSCGWGVRCGPTSPGRAGTCPADWVGTNSWQHHLLRRASGLDHRDSAPGHVRPSPARGSRPFPWPPTPEPPLRRRGPSSRILRLVAGQRCPRTRTRRHDVEWIGFDTVTLFAQPPADDAEREAWSSKPRVPRRTTALTDRPVVRYLGRDDLEATAFGWQVWKPVVARWLDEGRHPLFFVHTPDNNDALPLARRFHDEMRQLVPELDPLPDPLRVVPTTLF